MFHIFLSNFLKFLEISSASRGGGSAAHCSRGQPAKVFPRTEILTAPLWG